MVTILKYIEISNHSVVYQELTSKLIEEITSVVTRGRGCMKGELDEGSQKLQASSYMIAEY